MQISALKYNSVFFGVTISGDGFTGSVTLTDGFQKLIAAGSGTLALATAHTMTIAGSGVTVGLTGTTALPTLTLTAASPTVTAASNLNGVYLNGSTVTLSQTSNETFGSVVITSGTITTFSGTNMTVTNATLSGVANVGTLVFSGTTGSLTAAGALLVPGAATIGGNFTVTGGGTLTTAGALTVVNITTTNETVNGVSKLSTLVFSGTTGSLTAAGYMTLPGPGTFKGVNTSNTAASLLVIHGAADGNIGVEDFKVDGLANVFVNAGGNTGGGIYSVFSKVNSDTLVDIFIATLDRGGGNGGAGLGLGYKFALESGGGSRADAGRFKYVWVTPTAGSEDVAFTVQCKNSGSLVDSLILTSTASAFLRDIVGSGTGSSTMAGSLTIAKNLIANGTQNQLETFGLKSGANKSCGTVTLVAGTMTVANTRVTASSIIQLTPQIAGGTQGIITKGTVAAGTSFDIVSTSLLDTSTVGWVIVEPY